jgi:murein DD-endopeptidase MepM/ murein hydrolase activator NlpD
VFARLLFKLFGFALVAAAFSAPASAGLKEYPFRVAVQRGDTGSVLVAQNDGPSTVTASVGFSGDNTTTDVPLPGTIVLKPFTSQTLAKVVAVDRTRPGTSTIKTSVQYGDARAVHDRGARYRLPFSNREEFLVSQAFGGRLTTHSEPEHQHAVDIALPENTPILAARDGVIVDATYTFRRGGMDPDLKDKANVVMILHDDGTVAMYAHLAPREVGIRRGQYVTAGTMIGYSGDTGYSAGPHLHFAVTRPEVRSDGKVVHMAIPFLFYSGDPAVAFEPRAGTRVRALYR